MQNVGAAWLMTSLAPSPTLVAWVQAATSLPVFLVGLPSGAIADLVDRRSLLLATQGWMLLAASALGLLTMLGAMTPWMLLTLTFALGLGVMVAGGVAWITIMSTSMLPLKWQRLLGGCGGTFQSRNDAGVRRHGAGMVRSLARQTLHEVSRR